MLDFLASRALVAAIHGDSIAFDRVFALEGLCQSTRNRLKDLGIIAAEQIRMAQPAAFKRSLQQLHTRLAAGKISKTHLPLI